MFDRKPEAARRALAPLLCGLLISQALRLRDFSTVHEAIDLARRHHLPDGPLQSAAAELLGLLSAAMDAAGPV